MQNGSPPPRRAALRIVLIVTVLLFGALALAAWLVREEPAQHMFHYGDN